MKMVKKFIASISKRTKVAEGTFEISLALKEDFNFKAGQYMKLKLLKTFYKDEKGNSRDFSIASSPNNKKEVKTCFRESNSAFKKSVLKSDIGTNIQIEGPYGVFTLPEKTDKEIILIAGGIGITPFLSIINFATEEKLNHKLTLIYTNSSPERAAYLKELKNLEKLNPNFKVIERFKRLDSEFIKNNITNMNEKLYYICGPPAMVSSIRGMILKIGIEEKNILFEEFTGYN